MLALGVLLIIGGVVLVFINPLFGIVPGVILALIGLVLAVLALVGRGVGVITGAKAEKTCPDCRARVPEDAAQCSRCGHQFD